MFRLGNILLGNCSPNSWSFLKWLMWTFISRIASAKLCAGVISQTCHRWRVALPDMSQVRSGSSGHVMDQEWLFRTCHGWGVTLPDMSRVESGSLSGSPRHVIGQEWLSWTCHGWGVALSDMSRVGSVGFSFHFGCMIYGWLAYQVYSKHLL